MMTLQIHIFYKYTRQMLLVGLLFGVLVCSGPARAFAQEVRAQTVVAQGSGLVEAATAETPDRIRVGLFEQLINKPLKVTSPKPFAVYRANGTKVKDFERHQWVNVMVLPNGKYKVWRGEWSLVSDNPFYVKAKNSNKRIELPKYENRPGWTNAYNDNVFRGTISLVKDDNGNPWVVNELSVEMYVRGVAETSNRSPKEYLKAMSVAERSYAYYLLQITKYPGKPFNLTATPADQVYKGYVYEKRSPNVRDAVKATRGQVVTYNGSAVITPYFSNSDGKTRAWSQVWNGSRAWLQAVNDPYCQGMSLAGHGVGMSALGALRYANHGKTYTWILRHYYTDTSLKKLW